ncbi:conserved exported hypothetical protein [Pseudomonas sp. 8BK]|uniref:DUF2059 domain-containing protein n=1 Tax=Pseudomonas sp. 8BK TaxID=2653164 RepID=UPI0012EF6BE3|nr:DUF2059 domain-containing protein [Pseudomonas sp. 8BK]VXC05861.1 conserved exported hypothetical protein [Pseudomonas sp. 8BK]
MKNMKFALGLCLAFATSAYGGEKHDLVLELLEVTNAKQNHELMVDAYINQLAGNPIAATPGFEQYFREAMAWEALVGPTTKIYEESYTANELKAITEFFSSPIGKSFIAKAPDVNEKTTVVLVENMQKALKHLTPPQ